MRKYKFNEDFFETIDSESKAYFLGFIYADGCLINDSVSYRYKLNLKIHKKDSHILEQLIKCVDGEMDIWYNKKRDMCEISLSGKKMVSDLINKGVLPNKTFTIKYPTIDESLERHFLRGYFDGDGCIRVNTDRRDGSKRGDLRIVGGSINMLCKINERMNYLFGTNINKLYGPKNKEYKFIGWAGMSDIEKIYHGFYNKSDLFLSRKKTIFDEVVNLIKNKEKYRKK
jgi:hypothetical protein